MCAGIISLNDSIRRRKQVHGVSRVSKNDLRISLSPLGRLNEAQGD